MSNNSSSNFQLNPLQFFGSLAAAGLAGAGLASLYFRSSSSRRLASYSIGDQKLRFNTAKSNNNQRVLNIDQYFDPSQLKNKRVLVIGGNRGLGLRIVQECIQSGAETIAAVRSPTTGNDLKLCQVIEGIDVTKNDTMKLLVSGLNNKPIDILICNAGYFYGPVERLTDNTLNFDEEMKMIDICGLGPLRVINSLINNENGECLINNGGKIAIITSQAGSIQWRENQNNNGDNYGHHASRAVTNMIGRLLSFELSNNNNEKGLDVSVGLLHPGFNRTDMTRKYAEFWDEEGAVEPEIGAKRVLHEINNLNINNTGSYVNCEDGLLIPW